MTGMDMLNALHIQGDETIAARLEKYNELVMEKNRVMNLTGIKDSGESLIKNVYDSLTVYDARYFPQGGSLLDLGTGAGFPGMILAILRPDMQVVLMDAIRKKLRFIEEAADTLGVSNVTVVHSRAEDAARDSAFRDHFDVVTARAVKSMPVISEWALPFVKKGGIFAAMKGPGAQDELRDASGILSLMGTRLESEKECILPSGEKRVILYLRKNSLTPKRFPRKAGEAERKPIKAVREKR